MNDNVKPRAAAAIRARMLESFAPTYLTFISILQGSLLGYIVYVADRFLGEWKDQSFTSLGLVRLIFIGSALIANIAAWNEYRMGSTTFVWVPRLADTLVPFGLALVQFSLIRTITLHPSYWFLSAAGFWVVAGVAYGHMYFRAGKEPEINTAALQALAAYTRSNPLLCLACSVANAASSLIVRKLSLSEMQHSGMLLFLAFVSACLLLFVFFRGESSWNCVVRLSREAHECENEAVRQDQDSKRTSHLARGRRRAR